MKLTSNPFLVASLGTVAAFAHVAFAGDVIKANNTDALYLTTSWTGGVAPTSTDVAVWDSTVTAANSTLAGASLSWAGIRIANPTGLVTIGGATPTAGTTLTIGTSGIDMSAATQNLVISSPTTVISGDQIWNVASGRNLRFGVTGVGAANANLDGAGTITVRGGGVVDLNQGGSLGFSDAAGFAGFSGKWVVDSGTTLRGLRNGATAFGTNTAADTITLNGGTLATGGIPSATGNWSWNSNITLATSTSSTIDNQNPSGSGRSLKLMGAFAGSGNLTFASTGAGTMNADNGFVLTATNTNSGTVTINSGAFLRVGGVNTANDTSLAAGTGGTLGNGSVTNNVVNNGTLTFSRSDAHTVANAISGSGVVRIGGGVSGAGAQVVTLSGANSYAGATTVSAGTLRFANQVSLYNNNTAAWTSTNLVVNSGATAVFNVGGAGQFTSADIDILKALGTATGGFNSGSTLGLDTTGGNFAYASTIANTNAGTNILNLSKSGTNTLTLSGTNTYTGGTAITGGTMTVSGTINGTSSVTVNGGASLIVSTGGTLTTTGTLGTAVGTGANITVQTGATLNAGSANIAWNPSTLKVDGTLAITGNIAVATNASGTISGAGSITAGSFSMGNATTTVNFTNTGSMAITGDMTLAAGNSTFNQSAGTISSNGLLLNSATSSTYALTGGRINLGSGGIGGSGAAKTVNLGAGTVGARADWSSALAMSLTHAATGTTFNTLDSVDDATARTIALSGVLSGSGQLVKAGAGTLTLTGANTYTGATLVKAGKLVIGTGGSLGNTAVNVGGATAASTPTLGGVGTIAGATLISAANGGSAGTHAPGIATVDAGVGRQTFTNTLDYGAGSIFEWDLNGNTTGNRGVAGGFDAVDGSGVLTVDGTASTGTIFKVVLGAGVTLTDSFWNTPNITHTWSNIFSGFSSLAGGFDTSNLQVTGQNISGIGSFTISGTSLTWTAVPEPTSALAGLLLGVGLLRRNRATRFFRG